MVTLLLAHLAAAAPAQVHTTPEPVRIDGVLDESAWERATAVTDFLRFIPTEGEAPPGRTEVRFLQDDKNLYVGVRISEARYGLRARISRREDINADDQVGIYLDTFADTRSGYIFYFNGHGIQQDIRVGPGFASMSWDTVLRSKGQVTEEGFTLEVAIPWRSLKYPKPEGDQTWGLILTRKIPSEGAKYSYPRTERSHPRIFTQAAPLTGVRPPPRGSGLELIPALTVVQQATRDDEDALTWVPLSPDHPDAAKNWLRVVRPSLDARFGITPNLGLAATINPDFSQVDQDPTFIDLNQRFTFRLPENRPFFLDGIDAFDDQHGTLYTRSVVDPVYGAKLSGREGGVSLGVLHALDRSPTPSVHERGTAGFDAEDVEDAYALTDIGRVRVDAFGEGYVGATLVDKRLFDRQGRTQSAHMAGGADVRVPLGDRWSLDGRMFQSGTGPAGDRMTWGQELGVGVSRAGGVGLGFTANVTDVTPGLRRETGFLTQSGITHANLDVGYTFEPDGIIDTAAPWISTSGRVERNGESAASVYAGHDMVIGGIHNVSAWAGTGRIVEGADVLDEPVEVIAGEAGIGYGAELGRVLSIYPDITFARVMDYANLAPADAVVGNLAFTLRPTPGLRFDATLRADRLARADDTVAHATLERLWTSWQFTQALGLRSMVEHSQGNERDDRLVTSVLLTWLRDPWTAIHLGWVERTLLEERAKTLDRSIFVKASVLFRP